MSEPKQNEWKYMVVSIVLKHPFGNDGTTEKMAFRTLKKEAKKLTPAFVHEVKGPFKVSVDYFKNNEKPKVCEVKKPAERPSCGG